jgi:hypothetical protein
VQHHLASREHAMCDTDQSMRTRADVQEPIGALRP